MGSSGRRPDVLALRLTITEILSQRIQIVLPDMVAVVVEVVSHDDDPWRDSISVRRDREVKFREYADAGIPEYWIVDEDSADPSDTMVEICRLGADDYQLILEAHLSELVDGSVKVPTRSPLG